MSFPNIRYEQLIPIIAVLQNPDLLDRADCPYDKSTIDFFRSILNQDRSESSGVSIFDQDIDKLDVIEHEVAVLMNDFKKYGENLSIDDTSEKLQYFKTQAALLEKLINHRERIYNLKQISEFQKMVIECLEEICSEEQQEQFMEKLKSFL